MNYELVHLSRLNKLVMMGERLANDDYEFLVRIREYLRIANEQLKQIDDHLEEMVINA